VTFNASASSDPDGAIASYAWDWGDGNTNTTASNAIEHTYDEPGSYTVLLIVTDDDGATDWIIHSIDIGGTDPIANAGADQAITECETIEFNASASSDVDGNIVSYAWNYGDGTSSGAMLSPLVNHTYSDDGDFTVILTVVDNDGRTDTDTAIVNVSDFTPYLNLSANQSVNEWYNVTFIINVTAATCDALNVSLNWNYTGFGTVTADYAPSDHPENFSLTSSQIFGDAGTFLVTMNITDDDGNTNTSTRTLTISNTAPNITSLTAVEIVLVNEPWNVSLTSTDNGSDDLNVTYDWNDTNSDSEMFYSNGSTADVSPSPNYNPRSISASITHTFTAVGNYTANISVTDDDGGVTFQMANVSVIPCLNLTGYDEFKINKTYILCKDTYPMNDTEADGAVIINKDGITLDCNGATIVGYEGGYGIYAAGHDNFRLRNCNINNYTYGIFFDNSDYNNITDSNLTSNVGRNLFIAASTGNRIFNDNNLSNSRYGIYLTGSDGNYIYDNYFESNSVANARDDGNNYWNDSEGGNWWDDYNGNDYTGDWIGNTELPYNSTEHISNPGDYLPRTKTGCLNLTYQNPIYTHYNYTVCTGTYNVSMGATQAAIYLSNESITIECNNSVIDGGDVGYGFYSNRSNTTLKNCEVRAFSRSIYFNGAGDGTIQSNNVSSSTYGIYVENSNSTQVTSNKPANNTYGIYLGNSDSVVLTSNNFTSQVTYSLYIADSTLSTLTSNAFDTTPTYALWVDGSIKKDYNHSIDITNTVTGLPIYYYFSENNAASAGVSISYYWTNGTAVSEDDVGSYSSIAVDANDMLHVSYYNATSDDLLYSNCSSGCTSAGNWDTIIVASGGDVGMYSSIAVDSSNDVHVSYYNTTSRDLLYSNCSSGCNNAANWNTVVVASGGDIGSYSSIAIDSSNGIHMSHFNNTGTDLMYSNCSSGCNNAANWNTVALDSSGNMGWYTSIAVDSSNGVHVSYYNTTGHLSYSNCSSGCGSAANWNTVVVSTAVAWDTSIAIDSSNGVHVSYCNATEQSLVYSNCSSGCNNAANWNTVTVASGGAGRHTSIAIDSSDGIHISCYNITSDDLMYSNCSSGCTSVGNWDTAIIDSGGNTGLYTSIALDSSDLPYISYYDNTNDDLKYAVFGPHFVTAGEITSSGLIAVAYSTNFTIHDANVSDGYGVLLLADVNNSFVDNVTVSDVKDDGIEAVGCYNVTISNSTITGAGDNGIALSLSDKVTLANNTISNSTDYGIFLTQADNATLSGNTLSSNAYGAYLSSSIGATLTSNNVTSSTTQNIWITGTAEQHYNHTISNTTNVVNGNLTYYYFNKDNLDVQDLTAGHISAAYCTGLNLSNVTSSNGDGIIFFKQVNDSRIEHSTSSDNTYQGVYMYRSYSNNITDLTAQDNDIYGLYLSESNSTFINDTAASGATAGVYFYYSSGITLLSSSASDAVYSLYLYHSHDNLINSSTFYDATAAGVYVYNSTNNTFVEGSAWRNSGQGILVYDSTDNSFTKMTFDDNTNGIYTDSSASTNSTGNVYNYNNFLNSSQYDFYNNEPIDQAAANNWWGSYQCADVATYIYDYNDNSAKGTVSYGGVLNARYPGGASGPCRGPTTEGGTGGGGGPVPKIQGLTVSAPSKIKGSIFTVTVKNSGNYRLEGVFLAVEDLPDGVLLKSIVPSDVDLDPGKSQSFEVTLHLGLEDVSPGKYTVRFVAEDAEGNARARDTSIIELTEKGQIKPAERIKIIERITETTKQGDELIPLRKIKLPKLPQKYHVPLLAFALTALLLVNLKALVTRSMRLIEAEEE